jgi:hypothetical protein
MVLVEFLPVSNPITLQTTEQVWDLSESCASTRTTPNGTSLYLRTALTKGKKWLYCSAHNKWHVHLVQMWENTVWYERLRNLNIYTKSQQDKWTRVAVSIVSGYRLDDRAIEVHFPTEAKDSSSRSALGPTQPPVQWVPGVLSPGVKRGRGVMLTIYPHLVPRSRMSRSYISSPPSASVACSGTAVLCWCEVYVVREQLMALL